MFNSVLPVDIDWEEINCFFESNLFRGELLSPEWKKSDFLYTTTLANNSLQVLQCLHEDLYECYNTIFARDKNGNEDRPEEYKLLRELLFRKYHYISEEVLWQIYHAYLFLDR